MLYNCTMRHLIANATTACHIALLGYFALQQGAHAQAPDDSAVLETIIVTASRTPDLGLTLPVAWSALDECLHTKGFVIFLNLRVRGP